MSEQGTIKGMEGHVYVVGFESGVVKVGHTGNPRNRLAGYKKDGVIHNNPVTQTWLSPPHLGSWQNETLLIAFCSASGQLATGGERGEYFTGVDFTSVVEYAETLPFRHFDPEEWERENGQNIREHQEQSRQFWTKWFGLDHRRFTLPATVTELGEVSPEEAASLTELWASALSISVSELEAIRPVFDERLRSFMLDGANLKRDAEYLAELTERAQEAFEEHSTTALAKLRDEAKGAVRQLGDH